MGRAERRARARPDAPSRRAAVAARGRRPAAPPRGWALPEDAFEHRDSMITKAEVRALALARLGPRSATWSGTSARAAARSAIECARFGAAVDRRRARPRAGATDPRQRRRARRRRRGRHRRAPRRRWPACPTRTRSSSAAAALDVARRRASARRPAHGGGRARRARPGRRRRAALLAARRLPRRGRAARRPSRLAACPAASHPARRHQPGLRRCRGAT